MSKGDTDANDALEHTRRMQALDAEQEAKLREKTIRRGIVIVNGGDGKGKSTAAFGMALRAVGHGQRVAIVQFIKGTWKTGESKIFARFPEIDHRVSGEGFTWKTQDRARDVAAAEKGLAFAREIIESAGQDASCCALLILDEINIALAHGYLDVDEVARMLDEKPRELSIVLTGRGADPKIVAVADTVTNMVPIKHAFEAGIRARKGVDF